MEVRVAAATCLQWSQPVIPQFPYSSNTLASAISSPSSKRGSGSDRALVCRFDRSSLFGATSMKLFRVRSYEKMKSKTQNLRRVYCSASFDEFSDEEFSDEEFSQQIQELARRFQRSGDDADSEIISDSRFKEIETSTSSSSSKNSMNSRINPVQSPIPLHLWLGIKPEQPDWAVNEEIIPAIIERKANSVDLPHSLRIIKRKNQWEEGIREARESALCSVKKAFSSMVFIIREIQCYTLQMREILFLEDIQGILSRVQTEMNASFVWLFQQVFSHTPTLMVSVMILLANFTVYSMANNTAIAAPYNPPMETITEMVSMSENQNQQKPKFDSSTIKTFSAVGGNNGGNGGGKIRLVTGGADGGDRFQDGSSSSSLNFHQTILPDEISQVSSFGNPTNNHQDIVNEEELKLWNSIVEEASEMQRAMRDEALDEETMKQFVSPVTAKPEPEDYIDYFKTELLYQLAISQEPQNPLLLSNYAQFLYLVVHDHDRAEEYFNQAIRVESGAPDAEALSRYANFLWAVRKDLGAAEQTYLEAIAADPGNTFHASNYAHFLWRTGGEDTCYPIDSSSISATNEAA